MSVPVALHPHQHLLLVNHFHFSHSEVYGDIFSQFQLAFLWWLMRSSENIFLYVTGHLDILFYRVPVQVFAHLKKNWFVSLSVVFYIYWIYSKYLKYLPLIFLLCGLSFQSHCNIFWWTKVLNFIEAQLISLFLLLLIVSYFGIFTPRSWR